MLFCIADLITEIPATGGFSSRCEEYLYDGKNGADVIIRADLYRREKYHPQADEASIAYMESAYQFYYELTKHNGFYLHASAVAYEGRGYLFSGPCGTGKTTHTRLWQQLFGEEAKVFNDDKPALRCMDGRWYAYGTPWCGKDGININMKVPLGGICFLKQGAENRIRRLTASEAAERIIWQTIHRFKTQEDLDLMLAYVDKLVHEIPVYEFENRPEPAAARLSYETLRRGAEEAGL